MRIFCMARIAMMSTPPSTIAPPIHSRGPGRSPQNTMPNTTPSIGAISSHGVTCATGCR